MFENKKVKEEKMANLILEAIEKQKQAVFKEIEAELDSQGKEWKFCSQRVRGNFEIGYEVKTPEKHYSNYKKIKFFSNGAYLFGKGLLKVGVKCSMISPQYYSITLSGYKRDINSMKLEGKFSNIGASYDEANHGVKLSNIEIPFEELDEKTKTKIHNYVKRTLKASK